MLFDRKLVPSTEYGETYPQKRQSLKIAKPTVVLLVSILTMPTLSQSAETIVDIFNRYDLMVSNQLKENVNLKQMMGT